MIAMSPDDIQFVEPPKKWEKSRAIEKLGERWYVEKGPVQHFRHWLRELQEAYPGNLIPFSWVPDFVGVSRSALHKRAKAGKLTVFTFVITEYSRTVLGGLRERDSRRRYDYATVSECVGWRSILLARK